MRTLALALICVLGFGLGDDVMPEAQDAQEVLSSLLLAAKAPRKFGPKKTAPAAKKAAPKTAKAPRKFGPKKTAPATKKVAPKRAPRAKATYSPASSAKTRAGAEKSGASLAGKNKISFDVTELGGLTVPGKNFFGFTNIDPKGLGYFDPSGFTIGASEDKIRLYREAELKHGRIAMLAALGFAVGETYHPLFDGEIDGASVYALQQSLAMNGGVWILPALSIIGLEAISSVATFSRSQDPSKDFALTRDYLPGDVLAPIGYTFDPLGLKPKDPEAFLEMQTKELNNGRLAMIAIILMFAQEAITGKPVFPL